MDDTDRMHLRRCVELAEQALNGGNSPFGSVLVSADGAVLFEDHNRNADGDHTRHPEHAIALWAAQNLSPEERSVATVYTSGEHCAMCSAAHAWAGLGRIVYATSAEQRGRYLKEFDAPPMPINALPINAVAPGIPVDGPDLTLTEQVIDLERRYFEMVKARG